MKDRVFAWVAQYGSTVGATIMVIVAMFLLTACGTVAGLGSDIQKSAEWTKEKMGGDKK